MNPRKERYKNRREEKRGRVEAIRRVLSTAARKEYDLTRSRLRTAVALILILGFVSIAEFLILLLLV